MLVELSVVLKTISGLKALKVVVIENSFMTDAGARCTSGSREKSCWLSLGFTSKIPGFARVGDAANLMNCSGTASACAGEVDAMSEKMQSPITVTELYLLRASAFRMGRLCLFNMRMD